MDVHALGSPDGLRLEILDYGATVHRLLVPTSAGPRNVVLGHASVAEYAASTAYFGATVGRYANRIADGRFTLDGTDYTLQRNENGNTLHGGPDGFDSRVWTVTSRSETALTMTLQSPDGDQGFPGALEATVAYTVSGDEVRIDLGARTDRPTVVSLTNHSYFNLGGEGSGSVDDHLLQVHADHYTPTNQALIPTGELAPVQGTPLDFRQPARIGDRVRSDHPQLRSARGIDHNFAVGGSGLRDIARVRAAGLRLDVASDAPGVQVYTGNFLDGTVAGTSGSLYRQGDGLALEPQAFPDSPNQPSFGSVTLRPEENYLRTIVWRLGRD
ncbi:MAG: aldose epimerase family protein [Nocardioidaceae bacterium]